MNESELINQEAVLLCINSARNALQGAQYNLDGRFYGIAVNRAYYAFFYAASALLLTLDMARSKHAGVMAAFREHFVKPMTFVGEDSRAYGEAFELRNVADYETLGQVDQTQARTAVENGKRFDERCELYLSGKGYL